MRDRSQTDFPVPVEGIGTFSFGRRTMRDQFKINAERARLTEGVNPVPEELDLSAQVFSTLKIMMVTGPDGWDMDALDPFDDDSYRKLITVFSALRAAEESFRKKPEPKAAGEAIIDQPRVLVPAEVQPPADGPAVS